MKISERVKMFAAVTLAGGALAGGTVWAVSALGFEDTESAKADVCQSLDELGATITSYAGLNPLTATNEEMDQAYDDIDSALDSVAEETDEWVNAYDNPLTDAYWDMYYAVQDLDGDNTAQDNLIELEDELKAYPDAFAETFDGSGCETASAE